MALGRGKVLANNKKAFHDYFIEDEFEAGLVLTGTEIKSIRAGKVSIKESYVRIFKGEAYIIGMNISPYEFGNRFNVDPLRDRKLLLHKKEVMHLFGKIKQDGYTLVPIKVYLNSKGMAKLLIGLAKGKKNYDKRHSIAEKSAKRRMEQAMKRRG